MHLWSGSTKTVYANEMLILDTINLSWSEGSLINAPIPRIHYGATLLPNNKIFYIGKRIIFIFYVCFVTLFINIYYLGGCNDDTTAYNSKL
jgi:hypothetical protein